MLFHYGSRMITPLIESTSWAKSALESGSATLVKQMLLGYITISHGNRSGDVIRFAADVEVVDALVVNHIDMICVGLFMPSCFVLDTKPIRYPSKI